MARKPYVVPLWREVTFKKEKLDARGLITKADKKGIITFASKPYRKMTKFTKKELIGSPHSIVRHPLMPEIVFKEMWDTIKKGEKFSSIIVNLRKDGYHYWSEVTIYSIDEMGNYTSNPDEIIGYIALRREPNRSEIQESYKLYKFIRRMELLEKKALRKWEKELLEIIDKLPIYADDLLI